MSKVKRSDVHISVACRNYNSGMNFKMLRGSSSLLSIGLNDNLQEFMDSNWIEFDAIIVITKMYL